jgi:hypothetical protein
MALFSVIAFLWSIQRFVTIRFGDATVVHDGQVWINVAQSALAGGELYLVVPDNKPPLWQFINIFAEWSGQYALLMLTLVGIGNATLVFLAGYHFQREGRYSVAIVAALGCLLLLVPLVPFTNNKSLATMCLLLITITTSPLRGGLALGGALSIAQQTVFGVPAVLWFQYQRANWGLSEFSRMVAIAGGVFASGYLIVAAIWGLDSLVAAISQTILVSTDYGAAASQFQTTGGAFGETLVWWGRLIQRPLNNQVLFAVAGIGAVSVALSWKDRSFIDQFWLVYLVTLSTVLLLRAYRHYWVLVAAGIGACAAVGAHTLVKRLVAS